MNAQRTTKLKANALEITMLKQAIAARAIREQLEDEPQGEWCGLRHNHLCEHCNETWRCDCEEPDYVVIRHGCDAQHKASRRLAIALRMPSRYDAPYVSRLPKPKRRPKGENLDYASQITANDLEISRLKSALGLRA